MPVTTSALRKDIYRLLDEVAATGKPLDIERKGKLLRIVPVEPPGKLARLRPHDCLTGNPEDIVHLDWSKE